MAERSAEARALRIRRQTLANMEAILLAVAVRAAGRFQVWRAGDDAFTFRFPDVRTLVRAGDRVAIAERCFRFVVCAPAAWPFDRHDALEPYVTAPADWCHPNAAGPALCLPLEGVMPEELPRLLYGCASLRRVRLDECLDAATAAWVRTHLDRLPTDPRPLFPEVR